MAPVVRMVFPYAIVIFPGWNNVGKLIRVDYLSASLFRGPW